VYEEEEERKINYSSHSSNHFFSIIKMYGEVENE
jgi:hypothetical protein